jgi:AraC-like DNA-binding protein
MDLADWKRRRLAKRSTGVSNVLEAGLNELSHAAHHLWPHVHDSRRLEICYVARGRRRHVINDRPYVAVGGDVVVVFPGDTHTAGWMPEEVCVQYFICLEVSRSQATFMDIRGPDARKMTCALLDLQSRHFPGTRAMEDHLRSVVELQKKRKKDPLATSGIRTHILAVLLDVIACAAGGGRSMRPAIRELLESIDERLGNPMTVADMARTAGLSVSRFKAVFRREVGMPPMEYVTRRRIDAAMARLIGDGSVSATEVAMGLGFSSSQHFSTAFKRHVGVTPTEFRESAGLRRRQGAG